MWQAFVHQLHQFSTSVIFWECLCWLSVIVVSGIFLSWTLFGYFQQRKHLKQIQPEGIKTSTVQVLDPDVVRHTPEFLLHWIEVAIEQNLLHSLMLFDLRIEPVPQDPEDPKQIAESQMQAGAVFRITMDKLQVALRQTKGSTAAIAGSCHNVIWDNGQLQCRLLLIPSHDAELGIGTMALNELEDIVFCKWTADVPLCHIWMDSVHTLAPGAPDNEVAEFVRKLVPVDATTYDFVNRRRRNSGCFRPSHNQAN